MDTTITFHLETEDKKRLKDLAKRQGLLVSTYVRHIMFKRLEEENREVLN